MKHTIAEVILQTVDNKLYAEDFRLISNNHAVGVEIELEGISYFSHSYNFIDIFNSWKAVEDGSLRGGTEFIFKEPFKGKNITHALDTMNTFLSQYKEAHSDVIVNERCSIHVHLDIRDMSIDELNNLILIYMLFERVLFEYISPIRQKNNYCRPLNDSSFKHTLKRLLKLNSKNYSSTYDLVSIIKNDCDKYSALNVLPVHSYGSVEFRHHPGTSDTGRILDWINIILALRVASDAFKIGDILNMIEQEGYVNTLTNLFKNTKLDNTLLLSGCEYEDAVRKGKNDITEILGWDELSKLSYNNVFINLKPTRNLNKLLKNYKENISSTSKTVLEFN